MNVSEFLIGASVLLLSAGVIGFLPGLGRSKQTQQDVLNQYAITKQND